MNSAAVRNLSKNFWQTHFEIDFFSFLLKKLIFFLSWAIFTYLVNCGSNPLRLTKLFYMLPCLSDKTGGYWILSDSAIVFRNSSVRKSDHSLTVFRRNCIHTTNLQEKKMNILDFQTFSKHYQTIFLKISTGQAISWRVFAKNLKKITCLECHLSYKKSSDEMFTWSNLNHPAFCLNFAAKLWARVNFS